MHAPLPIAYTEKGTGPALVLVHGFPLDARMWRDQIAVLARTRRVIAVDLRGRGASRHIAEGPWTIDSHADDIALTLTRLGIARADFVGLSMGGYILFALWRRHEMRLRSLVLMSTRADADSDQARANRLRTAERVLHDGTDVLAEDMLPKLTAPTAPIAVIADVRTMIRETPKETAAYDLAALAHRPDATADLCRMRVPTLVVHGAQDTLIAPASAETMARALPGAHFELIAGAGHLPALEQPADVNAVLAAFLSRPGALP